MTEDSKEDDKGVLLGTKSTSREAPAATITSAKRQKREWLVFSGNRKTRVGEAYQVSRLPDPGKVDEGKEKETRQTEANEVTAEN